MRWSSMPEFEFRPFRRESAQAILIVLARTNIPQGSALKKRLDEIVACQTLADFVAIAKKFGINEKDFLNRVYDHSKL